MIKVISAWRNVAMRLTGLALVVLPLIDKCTYVAPR